VRSRTSPEGAGRCRRCWLLSRACACHWLAPLPVATRFVVVRHFREATKSTSTARWARLLVPGCELVEYGSRTDGKGLPIGHPGDWLLFPREVEPSAPRPSHASEGPPERPARLIILDGTWRQVRRMLRAMPGLGGLPRLTVPPRPEGARLRAAPTPHALSTLEAMAGAVTCLESPERGRELLRIHDLLVDRVLRARGRLGLGQVA
jgi:DTW domain-containing protein YfiP